jgi:hypothetical protein
MNARAYYGLVDAIAATRTADDIKAMRTLVASTDMHPLDRLALERQLRARALAVAVQTAAEQGRPSIVQGPPGSELPPRQAP